MDDEPWWHQTLLRAQIIADPRKFREYVLVPGHSTGKDRVFLGLLGFRAQSAEDSIALAHSYREQARQRIEARDVQFSGITEHGQRFMIIIEVRGAALRTGWLLRHDGTLWLTTPFRGFARTKRKD